MRGLEIPLGKRTKLYRFLEILPGALSYLMVIMLFVLSFINPVIGAVYLLIIVSSTLIKAIAVAFRTVQGYAMMERARKVNWRGRLTDLMDAKNRYAVLSKRKRQGIVARVIDDEYNFCEHLENLRLIDAGIKKCVQVDEIYHAIIMVAYNEDMDILRPTVQAVIDSDFDMKKVIFIFAYEERGGEKMKKYAKELKAEFEHNFYSFLTIMHPKDLKNEVIGKGPNLTYAGHALDKYILSTKIKKENVIVTSLDSDNKLDRQYLACVAYEFAVREDRQNVSYQPVSLFTNNVWDAPAPMRVIAISNSFFNVITSMRPHALRNFASHSQPLAALSAMDFWSKRTIVEDGHQFWRSLFFFKGKYEAISIRVPIYQDAVIETTLLKTLKAQFIQLRRWDYGASDVAYVGERLFKKEKRVMPFFELFPKFVRLLDGHVTLASMAPIVTFGGWIPLIMNQNSRTVLPHNLPNMMGMIQLFASFGLLIGILVSIRMLPGKPKKYTFVRWLSMILQWALIPIISIIYQSAAAFYAQTRLMLGKYMEKFDVTKKIVK